MNTIGLLLVFCFAFFALKQKSEKTRNILLVVASLIGFCMFSVEGFDIQADENIMTLFGGRGGSKVRGGNNGVRDGVTPVVVSGNANTYTFTNDSAVISLTGSDAVPPSVTCKTGRGRTASSTNGTIGYNPTSPSWDTSPTAPSDIDTYFTCVANGCPLGENVLQIPSGSGDASNVETLSTCMPESVITSYQNALIELEENSALPICRRLGWQCDNGKLSGAESITISSPSSDGQTSGGVSATTGSGVVRENSNIVYTFPQGFDVLRKKTREGGIIQRDPQCPDGTEVSQTPIASLLTLNRTNVNLMYQCIYPRTPCPPVRSSGATDNSCNQGWIYKPQINGEQYHGDIGGINYTDECCVRRANCSSTHLTCPDDQIIKTNGKCNGSSCVASDMLKDGDCCGESTGPCPGECNLWNGLLGRGRGVKCDDGQIFDTYCPNS
jgi:hypothetical protein